MIRIFKFVIFFCFYIICAKAVQAGEAYTAFRAQVTGKGQPILFIPGATCGADEWKETVAHYADKYQCHVLTMAGYAGVAPLSDGPYLETMKAQIEQYIKDNKLNNVTIVGHSIGGFMAMWIASEMKDHLKKVVIVDALPFYAAAMNPNAQAGFNEEQAKAAYERYKNMSDEQLSQTQLGMAKFMCLDSTRWQQIVNWSLQSDRKTIAYTMTEMMSKDMRQNISTIKVPVLVLAAYNAMPEYPSMTRETVGGLYKDQYKACATCTVDVAEGHTKHFIMYDAPQWYFSELDRFIKG